MQSQPNIPGPQADGAGQRALIAARRRVALRTGDGMRVLSAWREQAARGWRSQTRMRAPRTRVAVRRLCLAALVKPPLACLREAEDV